MNCELLGKKHVSKYLGLVFVDWDTGYCCEGYECPECGAKAQNPTMFAPEALFQFPIYPDAIEVKVIDRSLCKRRAKGNWQLI